MCERDSMYVRKALSICLFLDSHMCAQAFSYFTGIRSKGRNHSDSVEDEIHVCVAQIRLEWSPCAAKDKLMSAYVLQGSCKTVLYKIRMAGGWGGRQTCPSCLTTACPTGLEEHPGETFLGTEELTGNGPGELIWERRRAIVGQGASLFPSCPRHPNVIPLQKGPWRRVSHKARVESEAGPAGLTSLQGLRPTLAAAGISGIWGPLVPHLVPADL